MTSGAILGKAPISSGNSLLLPSPYKACIQASVTLLHMPLGGEMCHGTDVPRVDSSLLRFTRLGIREDPVQVSKTAPSPRKSGKSQVLRKCISGLLTIYVAFFSRPPSSKFSLTGIMRRASHLVHFDTSQVSKNTCGNPIGLSVQTHST